MSIIYERHKRAIYVYRDIIDDEFATVLAICPHVENTDMKPINDGAKCLVGVVNFIHKYDERQRKGTVYSLITGIRKQFGYIQLVNKYEDKYSDDKWSTFIVPTSVNILREYLENVLLKRIQEEIINELLWLKNYFYKEAQNENDLIL